MGASNTMGEREAKQLQSALREMDVKNGVPPEFLTEASKSDDEPKLAPNPSAVK